ncbi:MAG: hypothetical protein NZ550_00295 [Fimbriimonadales bacterium]|nr:hypothetical protein [Fimbriimonadales bacterium]
MAFNVRRYLIRVRDGQQYLPVAARLVWFREEHPDWSIETQPLHLDFENGIAVFQATIKDPSGRIIASATKMETRSDFPDFVEKAECVPLSTRILTARGWKHYYELVAGEPVLAYDVRTDRLQWVPLLAVRCYANVPVVRLRSSKGFEMVCTPDHRWAVALGVPTPKEEVARRTLCEARYLRSGDALIIRAPVAASQPPAGWQRQPVWSRREVLHALQQVSAMPNRLAPVRMLRLEPAGRATVWCPQTPLGTWVAQFASGVVCITGNTGAVGRALAMCGYGTQFAPELSEGDVATGRIAYVDSPLPIRGEEEAERTAPATEAVPQAMVCADCGKPLRKPQYDLSMARYHRPLCPECQRRARQAAQP